MILSLLNPYSGQGFFSFMKVGFLRLIQFFQGHLSLKTLAPDELQILVLSLIALSSAIVGVF